MEAKERWSFLEGVAPHTRAVFDAAVRLDANPVLHDVPVAALRLPPIEPKAATWSVILDDASEVEPSVTVREVLLRYALTRAIVDQGSDIVGVEMWHRLLVERCYSRGIAILHRPREMVERYSEVLDIGDDARREVTEIRAGIWAKASPTKRSPGQYNVFTVDGMRGGTQAHWFLSARFFPALLLAASVPGGLSRLVFEEGPSTERPVDMARRLRNERKYGLGWCLGDKAADLFAKWAVGTLRLTPPARGWTAGDTVIPMDQRIGRVMMRCGLMDEFFDAAHLVRNASSMFTDLASQAPPGDGRLPDKPYHLTVMNFRRSATARRAAAVAWLGSAWRDSASTPPPKWQPQEVVGLLCRTAAAAHRADFTPVDLDDIFMEIGDKWCTDQAPACDACPFSAGCHANNAPDALPLKKYIT